MATHNPGAAADVKPSVSPAEGGRHGDRAGGERWADPRAIQVYRPAVMPKRDVPFVPTTEPVVESILDFAGLTDRDVLYDLGCGDGRIVIGAAKRGARGTGVD